MKSSLLDPGAVGFVDGMGIWVANHIFTFFFEGHGDGILALSGSDYANTG
jgi:hypothetical protein